MITGEIDTARRLSLYTSRLILVSTPAPSIIYCERVENEREEL